MKEVWNWIQILVAALGGFFGWFFGGFDGFLYALLVFVVVDYITGVMCAIADKKLSSEVGFKGICKKVLIFVMVRITPSDPIASMTKGKNVGEETKQELRVRYHLDKTPVEQYLIWITGVMRGDFR